MEPETLAHLFYGSSHGWGDHGRGSRHPAPAPIPAALRLVAVGSKRSRHVMQPWPCSWRRLRGVHGASVVKRSTIRQPQLSLYGMTPPLHHKPRCIWPLQSTRCSMKIQVAAGEDKYISRIEGD